MFKTVKITSLDVKIDKQTTHFDKQPICVMTYGIDWIFALSTLLKNSPELEDLLIRKRFQSKRTELVAV